MFAKECGTREKAPCFNVSEFVSEFVSGWVSECACRGGRCALACKTMS